MTLASGTRLGRYEIRSQIGEGGMGEVYLAQDTKLDRKVALKILPADVVSKQDRMRRFVQEAKAASALNHPNIITIHEIDEWGSSPTVREGVHFIATEFIDGETLRERMRKAPMKLGEVLDVGSQIANALAAAHAVGIVHRDIKPDNVMLRRDGIVKVLDFGLAKLTERQPTDSVDAEAATKALVQTEPGVVMGTAMYMSPEQARGMTVDARTDVFSLGAVLYEMVAGCLPFEGSTSSEVLASILSDKEPQPLARYAREVPAELERIVSKALRKEREQRYQTTKDLMLDLQSLKQHLEFETKLQRSLPAELQSATATTIGPEVVETITQPTAHSTLRSGLHTGPPKLRRRNVVLAAAAILILLAVPLGYLLLFRNGLTTAQPEIKSLAVLPLENLSGDPAQDYFADGMTEELIASLSKIGNLRVISRTSVMQYKNARKPLKDIARELNVDVVVEGSVLRSGDRVRITVQLIHGATDRHLWSESYQRDLRDILTLQSEVGRAIANEIKVKLTTQEQSLLATSHPVKPEAFETYLKGRDYFNQGRNKGSGGTKEGQELLKTSIGYFEQAIRIQPDYALAYAGLARANHWMNQPEFISRSKEAAMKALQIDETQAEAHGALAYVLHVYYWDWAGAEREDRRAIELNPSYADAHYDYALCLSQLGRHEEAIREINLAEELDPLLIPLKVSVASTYLLARQYERAIEQSRRAIDIEPSFPNAHRIMGQAYIHKGMYAEGVAEFRKAIEQTAGDPSTSARLAWAYAVSGNRNEATKMLDASLKRLASGENVSKFNIALVYTALGDKDQAFAWLEKAYAEHSGELAVLKVHPALDSLHPDPRFADLLRRIGFPQ